ncbi:MAG: hypothetical protein SOT36_04750 [Hominisplanchenecus sp.]|nr:hypothetical protein [Hominisplanchenecus sp.]
MRKNSNRTLYQKILAAVLAAGMVCCSADTLLAAELQSETAAAEILECETESMDRILETEDTADEEAVGFTARSGSIPVDAAHFPDEVFRTYVQEYIAGDDGILSAAEMNGVKYLEFYYEEDLRNVKGIEYFSSLQYLRLEGNQSLTSLDLRKLSNLKEVECSDCGLTSLKVSGLSKLKKLICSTNSLASLSLSGLPDLEQLECSQNGLSALNVRALSSLKYLICRENKISSLDLSGLSSLLKVDCEGNGMISLKLGALPSLTTLLCGTNSLTSLDLSGAPGLTELYCYQNQLTGLDCTSNSALKEIEAFSNRMTALNLTGLKNLLSVNCSENKITALDVTAAAGLVSLIADNNCLPALNLSKNKKLSLASFQNQIVSTALIQTKDGYQTDFRASGFKKGSVTNLTGASLCADGLFWKTNGDIPANRTSAYTYKTGRSGVTVFVTVKLTGVKAWSPKPAKVNFYYAKNTKSKRIYLKWKKVTDAGGYQISYSTSSKFKKKKTKTITVKKAGTTSRTISNLQRNKTYYIRIRAWASYGGKKYYGSWSSKRKVKIQK